MFSIKINKITNSILTVMFIFMVILCIVVILSSFGALLHTNFHIKQVLTDALSQKPDSTLIEKKELYISQLEAKSSSTMEASTISFLFQLFSIILIGAGIYLLSESNKNITKANILILRYTTQNIMSLQINLSNAYHLSWLIKTMKSQRIYIISYLRTQLNDINNDIRNAKKNQMALEQNIINIFIDHLTYIKSNLKMLKNNNLNELIKICDDSIEILKDPEFVNRYLRLVKSLTNINST